jgi:hypothetical protein
MHPFGPMTSGSHKRLRQKLLEIYHSGVNVARAKDSLLKWTLTLALGNRANLARFAGVAKGTRYNHFGSKAASFIACMGRKCDQTSRACSMAPTMMAIQPMSCAV